MNGIAGERFHSARLKLFRASHHITSLTVEIKEFADSKFYAIHPVRQEGGGNMVRITPTKEIPFEFSMIIADAIHNLRVSLDHVAAEIIPKNDKSRRKISFPFGSKNSVYNVKQRDKLVLLDKFL